VSEIPLIEHVYSQPGYGTPSPDCWKAIEKMAMHEGILLDPVYTGKVFAGVLDLVGKSVLGDDEPIIFLHTGGLPALFAFEGRMVLNG
jgi:1-aminocyclopropane-1-carboxylate deaminase/D-cysteine desulfhydrase-like pyridoxal-dependent ACC family enzyme